MDADYFTDAENEGSHTHPDASEGGAHEHKVITPSKLKPLQAGDRVLVVPINKGQDHVVISRVVTNSALNI